MTRRGVLRVMCPGEEWPVPAWRPLAGLIRSLSALVGV